MRASQIAFSTALLGAAAMSAHADLKITVQDMNPGGGFFFTPFWVALHNGGFDSYDGGTPAAMWPGLTELAEGGDTGPIADAFAASKAGTAGGVDATILSVCFAEDAPVLNPLEMTSFILETGDPTVNRYFSYASMVIPTNDLFVANGNPVAHEVYDASGKFVGPIVIEILGSAVNDNGTEINDAFGGAAFSANGGVDADEDAVIRNFFTTDDDSAYLASFVDTQTVTGFTITAPFGPTDVIARIVVEEASPISTCPADLDLDSDVGFTDLLTLLSSWGACP